LVLCVVLALVAGIRLIHLSADPPRSLYSASAGEFVDEGYKTLSARNLVLFGTTHWNEFDDYPGWAEGSPITQLAYVLCFRLFGPQLASARLFSVVCFAAFLVGFTIASRQHYSLTTQLLGILLLGFVHTLFIFSRVALIEMPLVLVIYIPVFATLRYLDQRHLSRIIVTLLVATVVATKGLKQAALLYLLPIYGAYMLVVWSRFRSKRIVWMLGGIGAALVAGLLFAMRKTWSHRLDIEPLEVIRDLFSNPLLETSPFLVAAGLVVVSHFMLVVDRRELLVLYRHSLIAIAVGVPFLLCLFPYHPLRYFVPCVPAFVLLVVEWFHLEAWRLPVLDRLGPARSAIGLGCLIGASGAVLTGVNRFFLAPLFTGLAARPGVAAPIQLRFLIPIAILVGSGLWLVLKRYISRRHLRISMIGLVSIACLINGFQAIRFLADPSYQQIRVSSDLESRMGDGTSLAGDWAPFFALGTQIPALYMNDVFNRVERLPLVRPDYLLSADTPLTTEILLRVDDLPGVEYGPAVYEAVYIDHRIALYPLEYAD
jgi:hypothetical protein